MEMDEITTGGGHLRVAGFRGFWGLGEKRRLEGRGRVDL